MPKWNFFHVLAHCVVLYLAPLSVFLLFSLNDFPESTLIGNSLIVYWWVSEYPQTVFWVPDGTTIAFLLMERKITSSIVIPPLKVLESRLVFRILSTILYRNFKEDLIFGFRISNLLFHQLCSFFLHRNHLQTWPNQRKFTTWG